MWLTIELTHWSRVTHICIGHLTTIGSDNGLSPGRHQSFIWTNVGVLFIRTLGTNISENLNQIHFHSRKCIWKCPLRNGSHFTLAPMSLFLFGHQRQIAYILIRVRVYCSNSISIELFTLVRVLKRFCTSAFNKFHGLYMMSAFICFSWESGCDEGSGRGLV